MPPVYYGLSARSEPASSNFTVIFCTIASIIIVCLAGSLAVPKIRRRRQFRPPAASSARGSAGSPPAITFPSHPALCRRLGQRPSAKPRQYDPKYETPFPNTPAAGNSISLPSIASHHPAESVRPCGYGIFTPDRTPADGLHISTVMPPASEADCILPLPEPCLLRARSCGKAPSLRKQLDKFPIPQSTIGLMDNLVHPNKLFKDLEGRNSITSIGTPTPIPARNESEKNGICLSASQQDDTSSPGHGKRCASTVKSRTLNLREEYAMKHWTLRRLQRRGTWSSAANSSHLQFMVQRADTVIKPGTPTAATQPEHGNGTLKKASSNIYSSISKESQESTGCSSHGPETTPTSPVDGAPLNPHPAQGAVRTDTPCPFAALEGADSGAMILPSAHSISPMYSIPEDKLADTKKSSVFGQARPAARHRPTQLKLTNIRNSPSSPKRVPRHSRSSVRSLLVPLVKPRRLSLQASSIYSRNTLGVSITRSPILPTFSENASTGTIQDAVFRGRKAASSIDLLKTKIDNWCLDTAQIQGFSTSPSVEFKRALSDLSPYSPTFPDSGFGSVYKMDNEEAEAIEATSQKELPTIYIGRPSDDIFRDPLPTNKSNQATKVGNAGGAGAKPNVLQVPRKGSAPGGTDWV